MHFQVEASMLWQSNIAELMKAKAYSNIGAHKMKLEILVCYFEHLNLFLILVLQSVKGVP